MAPRQVPDTPQLAATKDWEKVTKDTYRLEVDGGYLYRYAGTCMAFVPVAALVAPLPVLIPMAEA